MVDFRQAVREVGNGLVIQAPKQGIGCKDIMDLQDCLTAHRGKSLRELDLSSNDLTDDSLRGLVDTLTVRFLLFDKLIPIFTFLDFDQLLRAHPSNCFLHNRNLI